MMPVKFSETTKVKNFRYVLNQRLKRIHRLIFGFGLAGFFAGSSGALNPLGHDSDNSGTLVKGVIPSWMGERGH